MSMVAQEAVVQVTRTLELALQVARLVVATVVQSVAQQQQVVPGMQLVAVAVAVGPWVLVLLAQSDEHD